MANVILNVHHILWGFSFVLFHLRALRSKRQDAGEIASAADDLVSTLRGTLHRIFHIFLGFLLGVTHAKRLFENCSGKVNLFFSPKLP